MKTTPDDKFMGMKEQQAVQPSVVSQPQLETRVQPLLFTIVNTKHCPEKVF